MCDLITRLHNGTPAQVASHRRRRFLWSLNRRWCCGERGARISTATASINDTEAAPSRPPPSALPPPPPPSWPGPCPTTTTTDATTTIPPPPPPPQPPPPTPPPLLGVGRTVSWSLRPHLVSSKRSQGRSCSGWRWGRYPNPSPRPIILSQRLDPSPRPIAATHRRSSAVHRPPGQLANLQLGIQPTHPPPCISQRRTAGTCRTWSSRRWRVTPSPNSPCDCKL